VAVTPPVTTACLPRCQHWSSADLSLRKLGLVPALLVSQVLCGRRSPLDPLTWRTRLGTSQLGYKAALAPALPQARQWFAGQEVFYTPSYFVPLPLSHRIREVPAFDGVSGSTIQSHSSSVRDVRVLAVWLCLTTRPCPLPSLISCPLSGAILRASGGLGHICLIRCDKLRLYCDTA
jgi:hypothetical protein